VKRNPAKRASRLGLLRRTFVGGAVAAVVAAILPRAIRRGTRSRGERAPKSFWIGHY
jgi:hypothetical protein